jgi:hypothetical protein
MLRVMAARAKQAAITKKEAGIWNYVAKIYLKHSVAWSP